MSLSLQKLQSFLANCRGRRIAVLGDLMLDVYFIGSANRLSPEAPVPVVNVKKSFCKLGGAANVMRNVVALGGSVTAFGVIGDDAPGNTLRSLLDQDGVDSSNVFVDKSRRTTEKQRLLAGNQQLVRMDFEDTKPVSGEMLAKISESLTKLIRTKAVDAVIFEDYAKGLLGQEMVQSLVDEAKKSGVFTTLDPHSGCPMLIKGLTLLKPNRSESFGLVNAFCKDPVSPVKEDEALLDVSAKIMKSWEPDQLMITLGPQGIALFERNRPIVSIPTKAKEVFDVSGAGDTVIAVYTLSLAAGASPVEAAEIANHAAGIVVRKIGTATASPEEIVESFKEDGGK
jgi:D-glycero-beta-D-manno-heptose-7-phosphate kinase